MADAAPDEDARISDSNQDSQRRAQEGFTRLGHRRPGTSISFLDGPTGEVILKIASDAEGCLRIKFCLYDSKGRPAGESDESASFPRGVRIHSEDGELLLDLPAEAGENIRYRLYSRRGDLLTSSDGVSTRIGPCLRMESSPRSGMPQGSRQPRPA